MPLPHKVTRTKLYRTLKKQLGRDNDWKTIAKNLAIVYETSYIPSFWREQIVYAFIWDHTDMRHDYWSGICDRQEQYVADH